MTHIDAVHQENSHLRQQVATLEQSQAALREQVQHLEQQVGALRIFETFIEKAPLPISIASLDGILSYANPAFRAEYGYGDATIGMHIKDFRPPGEQTGAAAILHQLREHGVWTGRQVYQRKDGELFTAQVAAFLIFDAAGNPQKLMSIHSNITEQERIEQKLHTFFAMAENSPDSISVADLEGRFTYFNPAFYKLFQIDQTPEAYTIPDITDPSDLERVQHEVIPILMEQGVWQGEIRYRRIDGTTFPGEISVFTLQDQNGQPQSFVALVRDISERKRVEQEIRTFQSLVENALDGVSVTGLDGVVQYANRSLKRMTGFGAAMINSHIAEYVEPEDFVYVEQTVLPRMLSQGHWRGEISFRRPDGSHWIAQINGFMLKDATDTPTAMAYVFRDVSDQKKAEEERVALQQQVIDAQQVALRELSTPLIPLSHNVVMVPLIGSIDSYRAQQVLETLLEGIASYQAEIAILDITGVVVVDTQVAQSLVRAAQAVKLLGAQIVLTGIQPQIAQTLVHLGADLKDMLTYARLQTGIAYALNQHK